MSDILYLCLFQQLTKFALFCLDFILYFETTSRMVPNPYLTFKRFIMFINFNQRKNYFIQFGQIKVSNCDLRLPHIQHWYLGIVLLLVSANLQKERNRQRQVPCRSVHTREVFHQQLLDKLWYFHIFDSTYTLRHKFLQFYFLPLLPQEARECTGSSDHSCTRSMYILNLDQSLYQSIFYRKRLRGCCLSFHPLEQQLIFHDRGTCKHQFLDPPSSYFLNFESYCGQVHQKNNILQQFQTQFHCSWHRYSSQLKITATHQLPTPP